MPGDGKFGSRSRLGCGPGKGVQGAVALGMGKEQELLEAARTGHLPAVEKLLSGKRLSSGFGGGGGGGGGSSGSSGGGGGGLGSSSHPLSSLLRWVTRRGRTAGWRSPLPRPSPGAPERSGRLRPGRVALLGARVEDRRPTGPGAPVQVRAAPGSHILTRLRRMVGVPGWQPPPHGTARLHPRPLSGASCRISQATLERRNIYLKSPSPRAETPTPCRIPPLPRRKFSWFPSFGNLEPSTLLRRTWLLLLILKLCLDLSRSEWCSFSPSRVCSSNSSSLSGASLD